MQKFKVQKEVRQEALVAGLKLPAVYALVGLFIILMFVLISVFSMLLLLGIICVLAVVYAGLLYVQNLDFNQVFSILPKILINR